MHDYNHFRPHDALEKMPPKKYAEIKSQGASPL
ncbi:MAG: transposase [Bacteroidetes bacterium]|nr:transposase [Bacteroidota bacterium]